MSLEPSATTLAFIGLAALVGLLLVLPALRRRPPATGEASELALYRDQLAEIDREVERGMLSGEAGRAARVEVERRILRLGRRAAAPLRSTGKGRIAAAAIALLAPVAAGLIYLELGRPGEPDLPLAGRADPVEDAAVTADIAAMIGKLEARLAQEPGDLQGWLMLGRSKLALGDAPGAIAALRQAQQRGLDAPELQLTLAETLTVAAGGVVTPEAKALLEQAPEGDDPRRGFFLGLADSQGGDNNAAIRRWQAVLRAAPSDAPWRPRVVAMIRESAGELGIPAEPLLAGLDGTAPRGEPEQAGGPSTPAPGNAADTPQIRAMVDRLETRLRGEGGADVEGWRRLGQARMVLGEVPQAREAYARANALAPDDPTIMSAYGQALLGPADPNTRLPSVDEVARTLFERAAQIAPDAPEPQFYLGVRALQDGRIEDARQRWRRTLDLLPADHPDRSGIAAILAALDARRPPPPGEPETPPAAAGG